MSEETRQQRRAQQRALAKSGAALLRSGLSLEPKRGDVLAVAMVVKAKLRERDNDQRASEAAELAQSLADSSLAKGGARERVACTKGCSYCCHNFVGITAPEAFRLARAVRAAGRSSANAWLAPDAVRERARPLANLAPRDRIGKKLPCPLLGQDGACSVYASRPLVCRQTASFDVASCQSEFDGADGMLQVPPRHLAASSNAHVALLGAMEAVGLPLHGYNLAEALLVALSDDSAERRWLAGEPVFAELTSHVARPAQVARVISEIGRSISG